MSPVPNIFATGARFGSRVVLEYLGCLARTEASAKGEQKYLVRCDCGLVQEVWRSQLRAAKHCRACSWASRRTGELAPKEFRMIHAERPEICAVLAEAGEAWPALWRAGDDVGEARDHRRGRDRDGESDDESDDARVRADELAVASLDAFRELAGEGPFTLAEVALLLGLSRERIRQIEEAALRRVRVRIARGIGAARVLADFEAHDERGAGVWELLGLQGAGGGEAA